MDGSNLTEFQCKRSSCTGTAGVAKRPVTGQQTPAGHDQPQRTGRWAVQAGQSGAEEELWFQVSADILQ